MGHFSTEYCKDVTRNRDVYRYFITVMKLQNYKKRNNKKSGSRKILGDRHEIQKWNEEVKEAQGIYNCT